MSDMKRLIERAACILWSRFGAREEQPTFPLLDGVAA